MKGVSERAAHEREQRHSSATTAPQQAPLADRSLARAVLRMQGVIGNTQTAALLSASTSDAGVSEEATRAALRSAGQPIPEPLRGRLESRLGRDFSLVRLHDGAAADAAARSIGAAAFTVGNDIVFRAGQPTTADGAHVLMHELVHVAQQSGSSLEATPVVADDATTEREAERLATAAGGGSHVDLAHQATSVQGTPIQRYQIEGPWDKNDPVHEVLTLTAIRDALSALQQQKRPRGSLLSGVDSSGFPGRSSTSGHNIDPKDIDVSAQQFIRGVIWPDDPRGLLFDEPTGLSNYSSGAKWYKEFKQGKKGKASDRAALIARSHFGDLQFFHGMATVEGEDATVTQTKIMDWARFLTDVAEGRISGGTKLADNALAQRLFPANLDSTVKALFGYANASDIQVRQRAAGALLHLIQDSYAAGHVQREASTGLIEEFHAYAHQDEEKHGEKDAWAKGKTLGDRIKATPGAERAVDRAARVLAMLDQGASTDEVLAYLEREVFALSSKSHAAGAGAEFKQ